MQQSQRRTAEDLDTAPPQSAPADVGASPDWGNSARVEELGLDEGRSEASHASDDHIKMGGDMELDLGGLELTTGEINMLVDYVRTLDDLLAMDPADVERGIQLIAIEDRTAADQEEFDRIFPYYGDIAVDNADHFSAPDPEICAPSGDGGDNLESRIQSGVQGAVSKAAEAGQAGDAELAAVAFAEAAFAGHYMADAYSSGHLFNKTDVMAVALEQLGLVSGPIERAMIGDVALRVAAEGSEELGQWRMGVPGRPLFAGDLAVILQATRIFLPETFTNSIVLGIHEELGVKGVHVLGGGTDWCMYGDGHVDCTSLAQAEETIELAYEAVDAAYKAPNNANPAGAAQAIVDRLPVPTDDEKTRISDLIESSTSVGPGMADAMVAGAKEHLPELLAGAAASIPTLRRVDGQDEEPMNDHGPALPEAFAPSATFPEVFGASPEEESPCAHEQSAGEEAPTAEPPWWAREAS